MYKENRQVRRDGRYPVRNAKLQNTNRNHLPEGISLYYIAIICPPELEEKVGGYKNYMETTYGCIAAKKSPAHLTIIPPFRTEDEMENELKTFVQTYNMGMLPIDISLDGFGNFGERVLFVNVQPTTALCSMENEITSEFTTQFPRITFGMKPEFNPHITIATRDIPDTMLYRALDYFKINHSISNSFTAKTLTLMKLSNGWWNMCE